MWTYSEVVNLIYLECHCISYAHCDYHKASSHLVKMKRQFTDFNRNITRKATCTKPGNCTSSQHNLTRQFESKSSRHQSKTANICSIIKTNQQTNQCCSPSSQIKLQHINSTKHVNRWTMIFSQLLQQGTLNELNGHSFDI